MKKHLTILVNIAGFNEFRLVASGDYGITDSQARDLHGMVNMWCQVMMNTDSTVVEPSDIESAITNGRFYFKMKECLVDIYFRPTEV